MNIETLIPLTPMIPVARSPLGSARAFKSHQQNTDTLTEFGLVVLVVFVIGLGIYLWGKRKK